MLPERSKNGPVLPVQARLRLKTIRQKDRAGTRPALLRFFAGVAG
jgi:hypothetical protein